MKKLTWIAGGMLFFAVLVKGARLDQAAPSASGVFSSINITATASLAQPVFLNVSNVWTLRSFSDEQLTAFVNTLNATPMLPMKALPRGGLVGTFWSLQNPDWPPLPFDSSRTPVWQLDDGSYLLNDVNFDYNAASARSLGSRPRMVAEDDFSPPGFGDYTNSYGSDLSTNSYPLPNYGTNLWIAQVSIASGYLNGIGSNTVADVLYEIQSCQDLTQTNWVSEGFFNGSELTNWTALAVAQGNRAPLFLRIRSWFDSTGTGIPDWWWLRYFSQTTNVNANASAAGDGFSNLQKFQMGLNPTNYYNPNPPPGFFGALDASGTNAILEWSSAPGPVINYVVQRGIENTNGNFAFSQIGLLSSNAIFFKDTGAITNANAQNNIYNVTAVYPASSLSATDSWQVSSYAGSSGPPYSPPMPNNAYAYVTSNGTNVLLSWTAAQGSATNYIVERGTLDTNTFLYSYSQIAAVNTNTTYLQDTGAIQTVNDSLNIYEVIAVYPGGGLSQPATSSVNSAPPTPLGFTATVDATGTNVLISWTPPQGVTATNFVIERGILNTNTGFYTYAQIGTVSGSTTSFEDVGAITGNNSYNNVYEIEAIYPGGTSSGFEAAYLPSLPTAPVVYKNLYLTAYLIRNGTGRWQVMFSGVPTNSTIQLTWTDADGNTSQQNISSSILTNGVYQISDANVVDLMGDTLTAQLLDANGNPGQIAQAGVLANDAPYFVDGRQHLKQNLIFLIRGASRYWPFAAYDWQISNTFSSSTNFEEFSFLHQDSGFAALDNLWPFTQNYYLENFVVDTTRTNTWPVGTTNFLFTANFSTNIPGPAILNRADPYWILQPDFQVPFGTSTGNTTDWGVTISNTNTVASLQSGLHNLFGLSYENGCMVDGSYGLFFIYGVMSFPVYYQALGLGATITATYAPVNPYATSYSFGEFASQCPAPALLLTNYFFAPLSNPNLNTTNLLPVDQQPFQTPLDDAFNPTNQTPPLIIGSIGQPMIVGGWAKYAISNSSPTKYAYLGQYFVTNTFLLNTAGTVTTNSAGVLSPYGEFFPLQAGLAQLITVPDIDTGQQGTNFVRIISLNADANHDGTMDFSFTGPDQNSPSCPLRFWVNDNTDAGDTGGDGIPGRGVQADGIVQIQTPVAVPYQSFPTYYANGWEVHGRRDLVDFFPVYLNIGSLFQSNALSAGISGTDTNYQFVLSQADGALRFAYTSLTPTNYMNYLLDTNVSGSLASALLTTVTSGGVALLPPFVNGIATNSQGVILVEAWTNTTQPLVLTIYHGTNQIAQTQLYLSISGVEQMFRSKNLLQLSDFRAKPDRLADNDVPNEPETINKNFVFFHGYNVNPDQARGVFADMFKRLYWSGSHAKFYGVMWNGYDTQNQVLSGVTANLQTNVVHAFDTAASVNTFLNSLSGTNIVAAHSLGNMVVLSTLNDYTNQSINSYFMIDAAVAMEALDGSTPQTTNLVYTDWTSYGTNLWTSYWHNLFSAGDGRSQLTWNNRLAAGLQNASVYNFYSSGEEVLRTYPNSSTPSFVGFGAKQILQSFFGTLPVASYLWNLQELEKGRSPFDTVLGSTHGGWKFNDASYGTNSIFNSSSFTHMSPAAAASLPSAELQTNAFWDVTDFIGQIPFDWTQDLALYSTSGSSYAKVFRNRLLSDTIPALTLPVGANPLTSLDQPGNPHNFNMQSVYENGWPQDRLASGERNNNWYHSDFQQVAYTFTYKLFNQFVTIGNLK